MDCTLEYKRTPKTSRLALTRTKPANQQTSIFTMSVSDFDVRRGMLGMGEFPDSTTKYYNEDGSIRWPSDVKSTNVVKRFLSGVFLDKKPLITSRDDASPSTPSKAHLGGSIRYFIIWPTGHGEVDVSRSITHLIKYFIKRIELEDHMPETIVYPSRCDRQHLIIILRKA